MEWERVAGDDWLDCGADFGIGMGIGTVCGSCRCIRRSMTMLALFIVTLGSVGWRRRGIDTVSEGPTAVLGGSME